ncbi:hypothetical protein ACHAWF_005468, partial [Thalassiosira exigua]
RTSPRQIVVQERRGTDGDVDVDGKRRGGGGALVKRLSVGTYGQRFLRVGYTLVTVLFLGFLFVFCFQVLLFLFIALPVDSGYTSGNRQVDSLAIISTILSFPVMMYGMSSLMALGSAFVVDTYNGAALFRSTTVEVLYMFVFLVAPIFTFAVSLMAHNNEPWRNTAALWAVLVGITFCIWALAVTNKEVQACFWLVENYYCKEGDSSADDEHHTLEEGQYDRMKRECKRLLRIAKQALILTQTARYSGQEHQRFDIVEEDGASSGSSSTPRETSISLYSRMTIAAAAFCSGKLQMFERLEPPKRIYSSEEVRDIMPFVTKNNWSMQKMWCSGDSRHHHVVVARGPSALTHEQVKYSVFCTVSASILFTLLLVGGLAWFESGTGIYVVVAGICVLCCIYPIIIDGLEMYRMYNALNEDADVDEESGGHLFQIWKTFRISQPKPSYCYARILLEVIFFFLWPFINMIVKKNTPVAVVFFLLGSFTFLWRYFDASAVLSELGSISTVTDGSHSHTELYRLHEVIGRILTGKGRRVWSWIFVVFFLAILVVFLAANQSTDSVLPGERATRPPVLLVDEFYWPSEENTIAYPSCKLSKGFEFPGGVASDLADYSFLSVMAYETPSVTNYTLSKWFGGSGIVVDEAEFVSKYRKDSGTSSSPVFFKLFSLPLVPGYAIMSIRGSETAFDWLSNLQLWSSAGLAQMVKWVTPFGWIWSPILPDLIHLVDKVESKSIGDVSYYKVTTQFVNDVMAGWGGGRFSNLHVTGVSLGG